MSPAKKKRRTSSTNGNKKIGDSVAAAAAAAAPAADKDKDSTIEALRAQVADLQGQLTKMNDNHTTYYASTHPLAYCMEGAHDIPQGGMAARHAKEIIVQQHELDFKPRLSELL